MYIYIYIAQGSKLCNYVVVYFRTSSQSESFRD